jgi:hypothetical protein
MTRIATACWLVLVGVAACAPPATRGYALYDAVRTYNEGIRWQRFEAAAAVVPTAERDQFLDERDQLAKDLRITDSEVMRMTEHDPVAEVTVKHTWYRDSEGTVRETVATQRWERRGKSWRLLDEYRARGDEMPGLREPSSEADRGPGAVDDAAMARAATD